LWDGDGGKGAIIKLSQKNLWGMCIRRGERFRWEGDTGGERRNNPPKNKKKKRGGDQTGESVTGGRHWPTEWKRRGGGVFRNVVKDSRGGNRKRGWEKGRGDG